MREWMSWWRWVQEWMRECVDEWMSVRRNGGVVNVN